MTGSFTDAVPGKVILAGNDVRFSPDTPPLARAQGTVAFSDTGFSIQDARADLLGGEARLSGGTQTSGTQGGQASSGQSRSSVVINVAGTLNTQTLQEMTEWAPLPRTSGGRSDEPSAAVLDETVEIRRTKLQEVQQPDEVETSFTNDNAEPAQNE